MTETAALFGSSEELVGIMSRALPGYRPATFGVLFLNAGLIHRVGANRLSVRMSRLMSAKGIPSLRFDLSGIGESRASDDRTPIPERWVAETQQAMSTLGAATGLERFVLVGSCTGALVSYLTALADRRVAAVALINPPVPTPLRYYLRLLVSHRNSWRRLLTGGTKIRRHEPAQRPETRQSYDPEAGLRELATRGVRTLLVTSEWDPSQDFVHGRLRNQLGKGDRSSQVHLATVAGADHDFNLLAHQRCLMQIVASWCEGIETDPQQRA